jgi:CRISPR-associated protein Cas2
MQYVVCYDIADDRRRNRVSTLLLDFGTRVQESVFVAHLDEELAERMRERLRGAVDPDWDKVHVFELCGACDGRTVVIGQGEVVHDPEWYVL